jgi:RimJ/RimL family protein N-acetyltransferase
VPLEAATFDVLPLRTTSLVLRHFDPADAPAIRELNGEPSTRRWLPSHVYADLSATQARLERLIASYSVPGSPRLGPYVLAVESASTRALLGHVGFSPLGGEVEVSYAIAEAQRGKGLGGEALRNSLQWLQVAFQIPAVVAVTASDNAASCRLLERTRFNLIGAEAMLFQGAVQTVSRYRWQFEPEKSGVAQPLQRADALKTASRPLVQRSCRTLGVAHRVAGSRRDSLCLRTSAAEGNHESVERGACCPEQRTLVRINVRRAQTC